MKVLVACEFSGRVRDAFIARGHDAISCDLRPSEAPGPHLQQDLFTLDFAVYDLIIAHPPCTYLCLTGNRWHAGSQQRVEAAEFVRRLWMLPVDKLAIENPAGVINSLLYFMPQPYFIQPWQFGAGEVKRTGLWTRGLPRLHPTNIVSGRVPRSHMEPSGPQQEKNRSRTYKGIADAMAAQWGS